MNGGDGMVYAVSCDTPVENTRTQEKDLRYGIVKLTPGNLNNNHLYLTSIKSLFPEESLGGGSVKECARQLLEIHFGAGDPVVTDIARDKWIFRKRAWVGDFFATHQLKAGDSVVVERTGMYRYNVYPKRAAES
jgi:hypothetical protein